jgi:tRNA threonylcarbamoyladenosine biosynthesis protein TsaE
VFTLELQDLAATQSLGRALGQSLEAGSVVLLEGNLGSGKTTLVQSLGEGLGIKDLIVSPTFTLINEYPEGRIPLYHLDLYRLQPAEVADLHPEYYWNAQESPPGIVAIEWPERLPYLPSSYLQIIFQFREQGRQAQLIPRGEFDLNRLNLQPY